MRNLQLEFLSTKWIKSEIANALTTVQCTNQSKSTITWDIQFIWMDWLILISWKNALFFYLTIVMLQRMQYLYSRLLLFFRKDKASLCWIWRYSKERASSAAIESGCVSSSDAASSRRAHAIRIVSAWWSRAPIDSAAVRFAKKSARKEAASFRDRVLWACHAITRSAAGWRVALVEKVLICPSRCAKFDEKSFIRIVNCTLCDDAAAFAVYCSPQINLGPLKERTCSALLRLLLRVYYTNAIVVYAPCAVQFRFRSSAEPKLNVCKVR